MNPLYTNPVVSLYANDNDSLVPEIWAWDQAPFMVTWMVNFAICWKLSISEKYESVSSKQCSRCSKIKSLDYFDRNGSRLYSICKPCRRICSAARRYDCPESKIKELYSKQHCECCGDKFRDNYHQHIHHVGETIRGVVCRPCNRVLGDESQTIARRITSCLKFMTLDRENLFNRDNQQGSPLVHNHDPSTTTREARKLRRAMQSQCYTFDLSLDQVTKLRQLTNCQCCGDEFTKCNFASIHHVGDRVLGYICNCCNNLIGQETDERKERLKTCLRWITRWWYSLFCLETCRG